MDKNTEYLLNALDWIYEQSDSFETMAEILFCDLKMNLEDVNDYLTAYGVGRVHRQRITDILLERYGGK